MNLACESVKMALPPPLYMFEASQPIVVPKLGPVEDDAAIVPVKPSVMMMVSAIRAGYVMDIVAPVVAALPAMFARGSASVPAP